MIPTLACQLKADIVWIRGEASGAEMATTVYRRGISDHLLHIQVKMIKVRHELRKPNRIPSCLCYTIICESKRAIPDLYHKEPFPTGIRLQILVDIPKKTKPNRFLP